MALPTVARTLVHGPQEWIDLCSQAESQGVDSAWTGDTAGADGFVDAAYALAATRSLTVGIGVAIPTRSPLQTATAAAALALRGRRVILGLGAGNSSVNESHGIEYGPVVGRMRDFVSCVTAMLRTPFGESVDIDRGHARARGRGFGLNADRVAIVLGAHGPAITAMAGELTDGLIVHMLTPRSEIAAHLQAAQSHHSGSFLRAAGVLVSVDEDETTAMSRARNVLSTVLRIPRFAPRLEAIAPGSSPDRLSDRVVREFVLVSTPARLVGEIANFEEADVLIPIPISLFMPPGPEGDRVRTDILASLLRQAHQRTPDD